MKILIGFAILTTLVVIFYHTGKFFTPRKERYEDMPYIALGVYIWALIALVMAASYFLGHLTMHLF